MAPTGNGRTRAESPATRQQTGKAGKDTSEKTKSVTAENVNVQPTQTKNVFASLPVLFFVWYATSVFCTTLSKILVRDIFPSAYWLTFTQFCVATVVGNCVVRCLTGKAPTAITGKKMWQDLMVLSAVFAFGMVALNKGYEFMHVSLVETLRATEPVVSAILVSVLLPADVPNRLQCCCLLPVVFGACMSSFGNTDFNPFGFLWVLSSNFCFCLRTIQYKQARKEHGMDDYTLFYHICRLGILYQFLFGIIGDSAGLVKLVSTLSNVTIDSSLPSYALWLCATIFFNGLFYYTYLQFSWVILMRVKVVTHAVGNCMRRPVVLICNVLYFRNTITLINGLGIFCAFIGVLSYTHCKGAGGSPAASNKKTEEEAESSKNR